jgi:GT2 family glycosyltransferase
MLKISIIIATYRRAAQLAETLRRFPTEPMRRFGAELVLVGSAPDDETAAVIEAYAAHSPFPVKTAMAEAPGFAHAQNVGLSMSEGELIVFTDDDCYLPEDYLATLLARFDPREAQYGMGEIALFNADDDPRIANTTWWTFPDKLIVPPRSIVAPGTIQGANMFFLREVLEATGGIRHVGAHESNDIMTAYLASRAGYTGVLIRGPKVFHDHGRKRGSPEAQRVADIYAAITGAYFAQLAAIGTPGVFDLWKGGVPEGGPVDLRKLEIEFRAAADEIAWLRESQEAAAQARLAAA